MTRSCYLSHPLLNLEPISSGLQALGCQCRDAQRSSFLGRISSSHTSLLSAARQQAHLQQGCGHQQTTSPRLLFLHGIWMDMAQINVISPPLGISHVTDAIRRFGKHPAQVPRRLYIRDVSIQMARDGSREPHLGSRASTYTRIKDIHNPPS